MPLMPSHKAERKRLKRLRHVQFHGLVQRRRRRKFRLLMNEWYNLNPGVRRTEFELRAWRKRMPEAEPSA